jgi:hypothetical protein
MDDPRHFSMSGVIYKWLGSSRKGLSIPNCIGDECDVSGSIFTTN